PRRSGDEITNNHGRGEGTCVCALAGDPHVSCKRYILNTREHRSDTHFKRSLRTDELGPWHVQIESVLTEQVHSQCDICATRIRDVDFRLRRNERHDDIRGRWRSFGAIRIGPEIATKPETLQSRCSADHLNPPRGADVSKELRGEFRELAASG